MPQKLKAPQFNIEPEIKHFTFLAVFPQNQYALSLKHRFDKLLSAELNRKAETYGSVLKTVSRFTWQFATELILRLKMLTPHDHEMNQGKQTIQSGETMNYRF